MSERVSAGIGIGVFVLLVLAGMMVSCGTARFALDELRHEYGGRWWAGRPGSAEFDYMLVLAANSMSAGALIAAAVLTLGRRELRRGVWGFALILLVLHIVVWPVWALAGASQLLSGWHGFAAWTVVTGLTTAALALPVLIAGLWRGEGSRWGRRTNIVIGAVIVAGALTFQVHSMLTDSAPSLVTCAIAYAVTAPLGALLLRSLWRGSETFRSAPRAMLAVLGLIIVWAVLSGQAVPPWWQFLDVLFRLL